MLAGLHQLSHRDVRSYDGKEVASDANSQFILRLGSMLVLTFSEQQLRSYRIGGRRATCLILEISASEASCSATFAVRTKFGGTSMAPDSIPLASQQSISALVLPFDCIETETVTVTLDLDPATCPSGLEDGAEVVSVSVFAANYQRVIEDLETRTTWLMSVARSGTTWISDIAWATQKIAVVDEPAIGRMLGSYRWEPESYYGDGHFFTDHETPVEVTREGIASQDRAVRPLQRHFARSSTCMQSIWHPRGLPLLERSVRKLCLEQIIREWGVSWYDQVLVKCPNDSQAVELFSLWFPNSRILGVIRDGRDVLRSRFSKFSSLTLNTTDDANLRAYGIAFYSHIWNLFVDTFRQTETLHAPDCLMKLHYENLRAGGPDETGRLLGFLGVTLTPDTVTEIHRTLRLEAVPESQRGPDKPRQEGRIGGYRDTFTAEETALMEKIMGRNLASLGYELTPPADEGTSAIPAPSDDVAAPAVQSGEGQDISSSPTCVLQTASTLVIAPITEPGR